MIISGFDVAALARKTVREIRKDRIPSLAAETAYYFFFSLFPLLLFLTPLLGLVGNGRALMESMLARLSMTLPPDALSLLRKTLGEIITSDNGTGLMSIGALLAAWSGSSIFGSLMGALNQAYEVKETRPWWRQQLLRLACLGIAGTGMIAATLVFLDGERVAAWVGNTLRLGTAGVRTLAVMQLAVAVLLLVGLAAMLYKLLPNERQRWTHVLTAAVVTTVLWIAATLLFRVYVQHFGSYNKTYGTIGGVIALLSWMYYSMFVVLIGGELASELHQGTGAVDRGAGAVYFGRIVSEGVPGRRIRTEVPRR
jgi:membrane protein